jgi:hypothetical protein
MWWSIFIIVLFIAQIGLLGAIAYIGLQIYRQPISKSIVTAKTLAVSIVNAGSVIQKNYSGKEARVVALYQKSINTVQLTGKAVTLIDAPITYQSLAGHVGSVRTATGLVSAGKSMLKPVAISGSHDPQSRSASLSLARRLGLIPPVADSIGRAAPFLRIVYGTYRELKRRGVL